MLRRLRPLAIALLVLVGPVLGSGTRGAVADGTPAVASPVATPVVSPLAGAATPAGEQLAWVLHQINGDYRGLTPEAARSRFTKEFLAAVPADRIAAVLAQIAAGGPWTLVEPRVSPDGTQAVATIRGPSGELRVSIAVEAAPPHRIAGLLFQQAGPPATPVPLASWSELDDRLRAIAPEVSFLAAGLTDDGCTPVHAVDADRRLGIGSTFKLYVLGELARQIGARAAAWDQELAIRDDLKSVPTGAMRDEPAGTTHTLRYFADQMISVSDNTAADHLLFRLGRERVEGAQSALGHGDPAVNIPFLSTREFAALKTAAPLPVVDAYLAASPGERRTILATEVDPLPIDMTAVYRWAAGAPRLTDQVEWFASATDLCRAMLRLRDLSDQRGLEPVREILAINPGVEFDRQTWSYVGFKGGSEPGVLNLTWLLQRADGRWFVLTGGFNNPDAALDENAAVLLMMSAADLLASSPAATPQP